MERTYRQLSQDERYRIALLYKEGQSIRKIAAALDRQPSTIARELKRNSGRDTGYLPDYAHIKAKARRWSGMRLERDEVLQKKVLGCLTAGWSPEQVSGYFKAHDSDHSISHETIYRFIYKQIRRSNDRVWRHYLPRAKFKRGWRARGGGGGSVKTIKRRISVHNRPKIANKRNQIGHWEADFMLFSKAGPAVLAAVERTSRLLLMTNQPNKTAEPTARRLVLWFAPLPQPLRRSCTFDNGTEFARHYRLTDAIGMKTYFCDAHAPWQKGGVENAIGRMRRWLPRKIDLSTLNQTHINALIARYNNTPRKCLDFQTPAEVFSKQLLHFKCESTPRPTAG